MVVTIGIITGASLLACAMIAVWMAGAIYYDVCGGAGWGRLVVLAWVVGVVAILVAWRPLWRPTVAVLGAEALFLAWWSRLKPSNDRDWDPSMDVLPRGRRRLGRGDRSKTSGDLEYRSIDDFTPHYEARTYHLSELGGVDVIFFDLEGTGSGARSRGWSSTSGATAASACRSRPGSRRGRTTRSSAASIVSRS